MSGTNQPTIPVNALWSWTLASGQSPIVSSYPTTNGPTKTGILPADVRNYVMVPLQVYGNPPTPISDTQILQWIRWAEDEFEQDTNIRLCQTWIAAPPAKTSSQMQTIGLQSATGNQYQQLGSDYDFYEPAYDFFFQRAQ